MYKEKQLEVIHIYKSMIHASHDVLNGLLNQMQLFKMEAQKSKDFDRDVIKLYDNAIKQASDLADTFSRIEHMSEENIKSSSEKQDGLILP